MERQVPSSEPMAMGLWWNETAIERRTPYRALARPFRVGGPPTVVTPVLSLLDEPEEIHPSAEALRERLSRNFTGRGVPKGEHLEPLHLEVVLTPEEATGGVVLRVGLPVFELCPACTGSGREAYSLCAACGGEGVVASEQSVPIHIAPMVRPGSITDVLLDGFGVQNLCLRLHTFVTGEIG